MGRHRIALKSRSLPRPSGNQMHVPRPMKPEPPWPCGPSLFQPDEVVSKGKIESVFLDVLINGGALRFPPSPDRPFTLKSGRPSPYFVNLGALTDGESLGKLKWAFASYIALLVETGEIPDFDYVFGPSYKGISLAALTCEGLNHLPFLRL